MSSYFQNTPLSSMAYGPRNPLPPSIRALKGVGPDQVPYSDEERGFGLRGLAGDLEQRQSVWEQQQRTPFMASHSRSPMDEARLNENTSPAWSSFGSAMATQPHMAANRGMRADVDLYGQGPGTGTGIGRMTGEYGGYGQSGSFQSAGPSTDLDTLAEDARSPHTNPRDKNAALRALQFFMRGR